MARPRGLLCRCAGAAHTRDSERQGRNLGGSRGSSKRSESWVAEREELIDMRSFFSLIWFRRLPQITALEPAAGNPRSLHEPVAYRVLLPNMKPDVVCLAEE